MDFQFVREVVINYKGQKKKLEGPIIKPENAANIIRKILPDNTREHFLALYLDGAHSAIGYSVVHTGNVSSCPVHPREVYKPAVIMGAVAIIVAHNHPSGSLIPSKEDVSITDRLKEAGEILSIKLLDHLIVTCDDYHSIFLK